MSTAILVQSRRQGPPVPLARENPLTLAVLGPPALAFAVYGDPAGQGSKSPMGTKAVRTKAGKVVRIANLVESADASNKTPMKLTRWREAVAAAAIAALPDEWEPLNCPLVVDLTVSLPRTGRVPKFLRTLPFTKPDLDKLVRGVADGIGTTAPRGFKVGSRYIGGRKIITEDSRITSYRKLDKVWVGDPFDNDALRAPGAVVRLYRYPESLLGKLDTVQAAVDLDGWWASLDADQKVSARDYAIREGAADASQD